MAAAQGCVTYEDLQGLLGIVEQATRVDAATVVMRLFLVVLWARGTTSVPVNEVLTALCVQVVGVVTGAAGLYCNPK